jgi:hypothetical protein
MFPEKGSFMHWFLTDRWIHIWITMVRTHTASRGYGALVALQSLWVTVTGTGTDGDGWHWLVSTLVEVTAVLSTPEKLAPNTCPMTANGGRAVPFLPLSSF